MARRPPEPLPKDSPVGRPPHAQYNTAIHSRQITAAELVNIPLLPPPSRNLPTSPVRAEAVRRAQGHARSTSAQLTRKPVPTRIDYSTDQDDDEGRDAPRAAAGAGGARECLAGILKEVEHGKQDVMSGRCQTCASSMKWPRHLNAFRCTVCAMINVLTQPKETSNDRDNLCAEGSALSLQRTRQILKTCITSFLRQELRHEFSLSGPKGVDVNVEAPFCDISQVTQSGSESTPGTYQVRNLLSSRTTDSQGTNQSQYHEHAKLAHGDRVRSPDIRTQENNAHTTTQQNVNDGTNKPHDPETIFSALQEYIISSFRRRECVNTSFLIGRPAATVRTMSEQSTSSIRRPTSERRHESEDTLSVLDAKTLLVGDLAENSSFWLGNARSTRGSHVRVGSRSASSTSMVTPRSSRIAWDDLNAWYTEICAAGNGWEMEFHNLVHRAPDPKEVSKLRHAFNRARLPLRQSLLEATEALLKRPGAPLQQPDDIRFLLILLSNPLLYPMSTVNKERSPSAHRGFEDASPGPAHSSLVVPVRRDGGGTTRMMSNSATMTARPLPQTRKVGVAQHSGIIKRILGLLSNLDNALHSYLIVWFSRLPEGRFRSIVELINGFITYRLSRRSHRPSAAQSSVDLTGGWIPTGSASGQPSTAAALHAAINSAGKPSKTNTKETPTRYQEDWQIRACARVLRLLFSANSASSTIRVSGAHLSNDVTMEARKRAHRHGQILSSSDFYNTLVDYCDVVADFEEWEKPRNAQDSRLFLCHYPFLISLGGKIKILEHDAHRQQEVKAREAFFEGILSRKELSQYLKLTVRRECLVEDSLKAIGASAGSSSEELKKSLRITFTSEEGLDAGGLRKEWFLLLVREIFNPEHGMFEYDDESQLCYFNAHSFETTDQFFLAGVVLGLAIYNSTILDIALPPFAYRKLLAAAPTVKPGASIRSKSMHYTLEDLAEYRPSLAQGLRQLLEYNGDIQATFCRDFVIDIEHYGMIKQVELCPNGKNLPVTNANRRQFVDLYVRYLLCDAIARQFDPFKRGFYLVCSGNALGLLQPEELELLVRGSEENLDVQSLRAVAIYENWGWKDRLGAETEPAVIWFWQAFSTANAKDQRALLSFITGSDRIPATGITSLVIKISRLGDQQDRYPSARTCFNTVALYRYTTYERLDKMLWRAVRESEGFGLK